MAQTSTEYVTADRLKALLGIPAEDHRDDTQIVDIVLAANHGIDMRIKPVAGGAPLDIATDEFAQASRCALRWAQSLWYERLGLMDRFRASREVYEEMMGALLSSLLASKYERAQTFYIPGRNALSDRVYLPSEVDNYLTREFF